MLGDIIRLVVLFMTGFRYLVNQEVMNNILEVDTHNNLLHIAKSLRRTVERYIITPHLTRLHMRKGWSCSSSTGLAGG